MSDLSKNYSDALKEFETLTLKRAPTLKNKGHEEGIKKLAVLFKTGKTLDQRFADYDKAEMACDGAKQATALALLKKLEEAFAKLNEGVKKNIASFESQGRDLGPQDKDLKNGFEVFTARLDQLRKHAKTTLELKRSCLQALAGNEQSADQKLASNIKVTYLGLKKGCAETEALMKVLIAKPTKDNLKAAFSSGTGPRSISAAVTLWKQKVLTQQPGLNDKLQADPEHLLKKIFDLTQRKDLSHWEKVLEMNKPGWEDRAKVVAKECLEQVKLWHVMAERMKALLA